MLPLPRTPPLHVSCDAGAKHLTMDPPTPAHTSPACLRCYEERGPRSTADCSGGYYYGPAHMSAEVSGDVWATLLVATEVAPASPEPALEVCAGLVGTLVAPAFPQARANQEPRAPCSQRCCREQSPCITGDHSSGGAFGHT
uniref:Uncharacterized protein n=1 Tax=Knipowitschia caucasica TaxID=637954 RepID=A0AAV2LDA5_KNICA